MHGAGCDSGLKREQNVPPQILQRKMAFQ